MYAGHRHPKEEGDSDVPIVRGVCHHAGVRGPKDQLPLFERPGDEEPAEDVPSGRVRTGPRPRRFLVQLCADDDAVLGLPEELLAALRPRFEDATLFEVDPASELPWRELSFLALDTETTGLDPEADHVIEVAWVRFERGVETERFAQLCRTDRPLSPSVFALTGINDEMLRSEPTFAELAPALMTAIQQVDFVAAYNAPFDRGFLERELGRVGLSLPDVPWVDPLVFIKEVDRYKPGKKLSDASKRWGVELHRPHRALADARATGELLLRVAPFLPPRTLEELLEQQARWSARQRAEGPPDTPQARPSSALSDLTRPPSEGSG